MPTDKQRREAARRHLERQAARRQQRNSQRRKFNLIATVIGTLVILAVVIVTTVMLTKDNKKTPVAAASTSASAPATSASPKSTQAPLPARTATKITSAPKSTTGPCKYTETAAGLASGSLFDTGLPPDPTPTPTAAATAVFTTNLGTIDVALDAAGAPCNVQSIEFLIKQKYYDNTACPRSVNAGIYVVQCGDPSATTSGGPSYTAKDESLAKASYTAGTLAMANSGANTNGSQFFFITKDSNGALGKNYTVIGHVTTGLAILQKVAAGGDDGSNQAGGGRPKIDFIFKTVTVS